MDILIPENIRGKAIDELGKYYNIDFDINLWKDPMKLAEKAKNAKAIIIRNQTKVDEKIIGNAEELQVIGRAGVGYDNINVDYASKKGIVVCYTPDGNTISTAELTIGMMLSLIRKIPSADRSTKLGRWDRYNFMGNELYRKTIGIIGFGKIGKAVASRVNVFGTTILAYDIINYKNSRNTVDENIVRLTKLDELLSLSDFVSIHLPSTNETRNMFNDNMFDKMKPGSYLINTSRGDIVSEGSLIKAIKSGHLKGAALDVRIKEPPIRSELENFENVILTPHVGGFTEESQERVISSLARDVKLVLDGKSAVNYLNFPSPFKSRTPNTAFTD